MSPSQKRRSPARKPKDSRKREQPAYQPGHRKPGRPSLLTPVKEAEFIGWVRSGADRSRAARACGLAPITVEKWMYRGRGKDPRRPVTYEYKRFVDLVEEAEGQYQVMIEANIAKLSAKNFQAAQKAAMRFDATWGPDYVAPGFAPGYAAIGSGGPPPAQLHAGQMTNIESQQNVIILTAEETPDYVRNILLAKQRAAPPEPPKTPMIPERTDGTSSLRDTGLRTD